MASAETALSTCPSCDGPKARAHHKVCRGCYIAGRFPTPLRKWRQQTGRDFRDLARESGVSYATIMRVAAGDKCSGDVALKLHRVTRISIEVLLRGR